MAPETKAAELEALYRRRNVLGLHWLADQVSFWYKYEFELKQFEFILVNCDTGTRERAFDHEKLARDLSQQTSRDVKPFELPLDEIQIADDASWVRFSFADQTWQFHMEQGLTPYDDLEDDFEAEEAERATPYEPRGTPTHLTIVNHTAERLTVFWIDYQGQNVEYDRIRPGHRSERPTYSGHVWVVKGTQSGKTVVCAARNEPATVAVWSLPTRLAVHITPAGDDNTPEPSISGDSAADERAPEHPESFNRGANLWVRFPDGRERDLTEADGVKNVYREKGHFSNDKKLLIGWDHIYGTDSKLHLVNHDPGQGAAPKYISHKYLRPGDQVSIDRPRLFDLVTKEEIETDDALFSNPFNTKHVGWAADDSEYRFLYNERGHKKQRLLGMRRDGTIRVIVEESSETFVDYNHKTYHKILAETNELLWMSERDGWNHLYLFDLATGSLKNQVTQGDWVVRSVDKVDTEQRRVYLCVLGAVPGQSPYYSHLASVNLDGSDFQVLTDGDGNHEWTWSPNGRFFVDTWSRIDFPPKTVVRHGLTGDPILDIATCDIQALLANGWTPPVRFSAPGRDGTTSIHGIIVRPEPFDPTKTYPVIETIYAGPQDFYHPQSFGTPPELSVRARLGYVGVMLDGMGTNWRSKAFHDICHKNLQDAGFPDRRLWLRAAAATRPWMDLSNLGCVGSSAGGQNAAGAVIFHGDFYKAACGYAGCHDNRVDKLWWNEAWMGYPVDESYAAASNVVHARRLTGKLLLAVGMLDENVDPACTMRLADALAAADKEFELVVMPQEGHQVMRHPYVQRRQNDFFRRHLQGSVN